MLSDQIAKAMTRYFDWWTEQSSERVYGFVFFSTSLLEYGGCTVFTEEGLDQVVERYRSMEGYRDTPSDRLSAELRWSPCDSPHHMVDEEIFSEVCESLDELSTEFYEMEDDVCEVEVEKVYQEIIKGILKFRRERIPLERDDVVVTMLWGDMSPEEIVRFVEACNGEEAAQRCIREMGLDADGG